MAESPKRLATSPSAPSTAMVTASSASVMRPFSRSRGDAIAQGCAPASVGGKPLEDPVLVERREAVVAAVDERVVTSPRIHRKPRLRPGTSGCDDR